MLGNSRVVHGFHEIFTDDFNRLYGGKTSYENESRPAKPCLCRNICYLAWFCPEKIGHQILTHSLPLNKMSCFFLVWKTDPGHISQFCSSMAGESSLAMGLPFYASPWLDGFMWFPSKNEDVHELPSGKLTKRALYGIYMGYNGNYPLVNIHR